MIHRLSFVILFLVFLLSLTAQKFTNSDLDGTIYPVGSLPIDWQNVPANDVNCRAITAGMDDTPDVTNTHGPDQPLGVMGNPYSGSTFVSGLLLDYRPIHFYHEGIMQSVSGLVPGKEYEIGFFQTVVKQKNALDTSGSWAVYRDSTLIGISEPSISKLPYNSTNLFWDFEVIAFTATDSIHVFKFLPEDDDTLAIASFTDSSAGLRMGIDNILFIKSVEFFPSSIDFPNVFTPNNDGINDVFRPTMIEGISKLSLSIYNRWGQVIFETSDVEFSWDGDGYPDGVYYYFSEYVDINGNAETKTGYITLINN